MPRLNIVNEVDIQRTSRVMQVEGMFDIPIEKVSRREWLVDMALPAQWHIGLIVGASGSGKTTVARHLFPGALIEGYAWNEKRSLLDSFPADMGIKDITGLLSSVGFSSPPAWLRPFHALSNGEQFRVTLARMLAEQRGKVAVMDEFSSVVDRTVAQIGSHALQKTIRRQGQQFVAVSCHYDIIDWLEPDWIYEPATGQLTLGRSRRRPEIQLTLYRVHRNAWEIFRHHHYLDTKISTAARCYVALLNDAIPVAFTSAIHFAHPKRANVKREHRTVCLPDYQGVGIGNRVSEMLGAICRGAGYDFISSTSSPAMIQHRNRSPLWKMTKAPARRDGARDGGRFTGARTTDRLIASFEYLGPGLDSALARVLWEENVTDGSL